MTADNREITRRVFEEIWNNKKLDVIDELMAADYVHHDPQSPDVPSGIEGYKQFVSYYLNAFPDLHFTIEDEFAGGIPRTGRQFSVTGMTIARVRDGKFIESWGNWDALGLMQQLGVVPSEDRGRAA